MKIITECYKTSDGQLFEDEDKAIAHDNDILGQELDQLLKLAEIDITRNMECGALLRWMSRRKELTESIDMLHAILHHGDDSNE